MEKDVHGKVPLGVTLSISRFCNSLLILIEREKRRLWKWGGLRRRGATQQAKGSTDIHGNLQIYSAAIISINAERRSGKARGGGQGVWDSSGGSALAREMENTGNEESQ